MPELALELDFARSIALQAGALLESYRSRMLHVETKSSSSDPVSEADRDSEALIVAAIRSRYPQDGVIGEEGARVDGASGRQWVIDPLDGTVNYLYGRDEWAVSIALQIDDEPVVGVVYQPKTGRLFCAEHGGGARLNGHRIESTAAVSLESCLLATGFSYEADLRARQGAEIALVLADVRDVRRGGSAALELCSIASGQTDLYLERFIRPWDIAAGMVIAREAGAVANQFPSERGYVGILAGAAPAVAALAVRLEGEFAVGGPGEMRALALGAIDASAHISHGERAKGWGSDAPRTTRVGVTDSGSEVAVACAT